MATTTKKYVSIEKLGLYHEKMEKLMTDADAAILAAAKAHAEGLADNYDTAGAAATVQANLDAEAATARAAEQANAAAAKQAQDEVDALEQVVAGKADQSALDTLDTYVGDIPSTYTETNVIAYINKKAEETLAAAQGGSSETAASVKAALDTYKSETDPKIEANATAASNAQSAAEAAQAAADKAQGEVDALEQTHANDKASLEDADAAQVERIAALEGQIVGLSGAMHFEGVVETDPTTITSGYENGDTVIYGNKEYVWNNGAFVEFGDTSANAEAITELTGRVTTAEGKITTAEGKIATLEGAVATKVEQNVYDEKIAALEGADAGQVERIAALEGKFGTGEGTVESQIAAAKQEAIDASAAAADEKDAAILAQSKKYTDDEIDKVEGTISALTETVGTKAAQADLTAAVNRITANEGAIGTLQGEMDAVEAKAAANESAIGSLTTTVGTKAAQSDLDAAVGRIAANETAIAAFIECSEEEINNLFA